MFRQVSIYTVYSDIDGPCALQDQRNEKLLRILENRGVRLPIGRIAFEAHRKTFESLTAEIDGLWLILEYDGCYHVMKAGRYTRFGSIEVAEEYIERAITYQKAGMQ